MTRLLQYLTALVLMALLGYILVGVACSDGWIEDAEWNLEP